MQKRSSSFSISVLTSLKEVFYPSFCLSCAEQQAPLFCPPCLEMWSWVEVPPEERCFKTSATCEPIGPPLVLANKLQSGQYFLAETIADLMLWRWSLLEWPLPDLILPLPYSRWPRWRLKERAAWWLASAFSKRLLKTPVPAFPATGQEILFIGIQEDPEAVQRAHHQLDRFFPKRTTTLYFLN